jgi:lipopolysaccharide transport system ATP-binding protein
MAQNVAIEVERLCKAYRIGVKEQRQETLIAALGNFVRSPIQNFRNLRKLSRFDDVGLDSTQRATPSDVIWALRDLSFQVNHGEVVGIIGSNGAGKSTLLKILSRITEPTTGRAKIHGRVGSLLEVGTGFHPDLTGRENVYLNGTILGMKKREIDHRFDEIVEFSGVARFIDTPVKRYSSGMRVRLAFSVAAHLEPEILIIDEVLAVGDINFQKKCLGKMNEVAEHGRTVLFVSHNLGFVKDLCQTGILLNAGQVSFTGPVLDAIARYSGLLEEGEEGANGSKGGWSNMRLIDPEGTAVDQFDNSESIGLEATLQVREAMESAKPICLIEGSDGQLLIHDSPGRAAPLLLQPGSYQLRFTLPALWLAPDAYSIHLKFVGTTQSGRRVREVSPRLLLDITDRHNVTEKRTRARLSPSTDWSIRQAPPA